MEQRFCQGMDVYSLSFTLGTARRIRRTCQLCGPTLSTMSTAAPLEHLAQRNALRNLLCTMHIVLASSRGRVCVQQWQGGGQQSGAQILRLCTHTL